MIRLSSYQGESRYCVAGFVTGRDNSRVVGWTETREEAERLLEAVRSGKFSYRELYQSAPARWVKYADGEIKDFGHRGATGSTPPSYSGDPGSSPGVGSIRQE